MRNSQIGWHQGEVYSISNLLVSTSLGSELYLYLSGNWDFGDSAMWLVYRLNCYQFPRQTAILCFYIFTFPKHKFLSKPFETQGKPRRLKQKAFYFKGQGHGGLNAV